MKSNIFKTKSFWLSVAMCLFPIVLSAAFYNKMPDMVATHFGVDNVPDGFSPKWQAAFLIPSFMMVLNVFTWFIIESDPKKQGINKKLKNIIRWIIPILSVVMQCSIIMYSINENINIVRFVPLLIGILFVVIGNYLPKSKQSYTTGIKLPWTLASEENWNKTHRVAGKLWVVGGFAMMIYTFFELPLFIFIGVIFVIVFVPAIYSYGLYKKGI